RPASTSARPTAADPMSLTRPIPGWDAMVTTSESFSRPVLSSSTIRISSTTAISKTRFQLSAATTNASGTASASTTSSSRNAASLRAAARRPFQEFTVARSSRSTSKPGGRRQRPRLAAALLLDQVGEQERELDRLLGIEPRVADRVVAVVELGVGDRPRAAGAFGDFLAGHFEVHAARVGTLRGVGGKE